jgi:hypothetical protein
MGILRLLLDFAFAKNLRLPIEPCLLYGWCPKDDVKHDVERMNLEIGSRIGVQVVMWGGRRGGGVCTFGIHIYIYRHDCFI